VVAIIVATFLSSCSSESSEPTSGPRTRVVTTASPLGSGDQRLVTLTDRAKNTVVRVHLGDHVRVILDSTYWTFGPASNPAVLRSLGPAHVTTRSGCVPGQGCGTVTDLFNAVAPGTTTIIATRSSCGEAMGCTAESGTYRVTVRVT